ncbi:MAG: hypothetical protein J6B85_08775 [Lachnospiraceae bacterium]|nr:hypothetical protein [Lachnospiraceae bacterium]
MAPRLLKERITLKKAAGVLLCFAGILVCSFSSPTEKNELPAVVLAAKKDKK